MDSDKATKIMCTVGRGVKYLCHQAIIFAGTTVFGLIAAFFLMRFLAGFVY